MQIKRTHLDSHNLKYIYTPLQIHIYNLSVSFCISLISDTKNLCQFKYIIPYVD